MSITTRTLRRDVLEEIDRLLAAGVPIMGTSPKSIAAAEDRELFRQLLEKVNLKSLINKAGHLIQQDLDSKKVKFESKFEEADWKVIINKNQIQN